MFQRSQRDGHVGIVLEYDGGAAITKSAGAVDRNGRVSQRDYCLLDLEIYLEAQRLGIRWLKKDFHIKTTCSLRLSLGVMVESAAREVKRAS